MLNSLEGCWKACCAHFFLLVILFSAQNLDDALSSSSFVGASVHVSSNQSIRDGHLCFAAAIGGLPLLANTAEEAFSKLQAGMEIITISIVYGKKLAILQMYLVVQKSHQKN